MFGFGPDQKNGHLLFTHMSFLVFFERMRLFRWSIDGFVVQLQLQPREAVWAVTAILGSGLWTQYYRNEPTREIHWILLQYWATLVSTMDRNAPGVVTERCRLPLLWLGEVEVEEVRGTWVAR